MKIFDILGEVSINQQGIKMKLISFRNMNDVDVYFETDDMVNTSYALFKKGLVTCPSVVNTHNNVSRIDKRRSEQMKLRLGKVGIMNNGMKCEIIEYKSATDITVRFEDGIIRERIDYQNFIKGNVRHPKDIGGLKSRIGEENINKEGFRMKIVEYNHARDMTIQFEDGTIRKRIPYTRFKEGRVLKRKENLK